MGRFVSNGFIISTSFSGSIPQIQFSSLKGSVDLKDASLHLILEVGSIWAHKWQCEFLMYPFFGYNIFDVFDYRLRGRMRVASMPMN